MKNGKFGEMKIIGIVAEYNPFHKGHKYHIEKSLEVTGADAVVAVMSGNFVQRGEPAIVNKIARARAAVECGVDLVLDLPVAYSLSSAEMFAFGSVGILNATGVINYLCFGSETGSINDIVRVADFLIVENEDYKAALKNILDNGKSYAAASFEALRKTYGDPDLIDQLANSNNILAIEYVKSLKKIKSSIIPVAIKRVCNDYTDTFMTGDISSATAIREGIICSDIESVKHSITNSSEIIINSEFSIGRGPVSIKSFEDILLWNIRLKTASEIAMINGVNEGIEFRLKDAAEHGGGIDELIEKAKTRRYSEAFIKRLIFSIIFGITKEDFNVFRNMDNPGYIKVLDFNEKGKEILARIKKSSSVPLITKASKIHDIDEHAVKRLAEINQKATDLYVLGYKNKNFRYGGQEFTSNNRQGDR